jgi:uncharacterized protein YodC (DUF2158 family)
LEGAVNYCKFKVGDVVRVVSGSWDRLVGEPVKIEKQHRSNGNLKVGNKWFSESGSDRSRWGSESLVLDGSEECKQLMGAYKLKVAVNNLLHVRWHDLPADLVHEIHEKVRDAKKEEAK